MTTPQSTPSGPYKVVEDDVDGVAISWIENDEGRLDDGELAKRLNAQHRQIEEQAKQIKLLIENAEADSKEADHLHDEIERLKKLIDDAFVDVEDLDCDGEDGTMPTSDIVERLLKFADDPRDFTSRPHLKAEKLLREAADLIDRTTFVTKDGARVYTGKWVYVAFSSLRFKVVRDGTVPVSVPEGDGWRDMRVDEAYSTEEAKRAAEAALQEQQAREGET